ncbi:MAG: NUDIX hydrolase [Patescibacteria group bacterium]
MCQPCPSYHSEIRRLIEASEAKGEAQEQADIAAGKTLFNGPLGRALALSPVEWPRAHYKEALVEETLLIYTDGKPTWKRFVAGETRFFDSRRQWSAFTQAREILEANLPPADVRASIFDLFKHSYGAMGICRRYESDGTPYVLMGIRGEKLATKNIGQASFPAGMAVPNESIMNTLLREFKEETGVGFDQVLLYPGLAIAYFPDCCSMTFTGLLETKTRQPLKTCYEVKGKVFTWVPEHALAETIATGNNMELVQTFLSHDVNVPDDLKVTNDGAATYLQLATIYPP